MKYWAMVTAVFVAMLAGCDRKGSQESQYDPKVDALPSPVLNVQHDPSILADQAQISRAAEPKTATPAPTGTATPAPTPAATGPSATGPGTGPAETPAPAPAPTATPAPVPGPGPVGGPPMGPGGTPVDPATDKAVKDVLAKMVAADKPGAREGILAFFEQQDAATLKALMDTANKLDAKTKAVETLAQSKLGYDLAAKNKGGGAPSGSLLGDTKLESYRVAKVGDEILASGAGIPIKFTKVGNDWKAGIPKSAQPMIALLTDLCNGMDRVCDAVTAGINNNSITKDNIDKKIEEIGKKELEAPMGKFMQAIMGGMMGEMMPGPGAMPGMPERPTPPAPAP